MLFTYYCKVLTAIVFVASIIITDFALPAVLAATTIMVALTFRERCRDNRFRRISVAAAMILLAVVVVELACSV